ncbi:MAG: SecDF P1 head subdomain-containing protein [Limisphaerales bacterium]
MSLILALALTLTALCGCQTSKKDKQVSAVRIHLESSGDVPDSTQTIKVIRADPLMLTIDKEPIFQEANLVGASTIDTEGGFAVQLDFDEISTALLEQYTAGNLGKHLAIFGQWGEKLSDGRWLGAPMITQRIYNGKLTFTPDMSREEANEFIVGLTNVIKKVQKGQLQ